MRNNIFWSKYDPYERKKLFAYEPAHDVDPAVMPEWIVF